MTYSSPEPLESIQLTDMLVLGEHINTDKAAPSCFKSLFRSHSLTTRETSLSMCLLLFVALYSQLCQVCSLGGPAFSLRERMFVKNSTHSNP